ncbi:MAG: phosphate uptake regulator PhoU [Planctomycetes bacterium]|nr:phosphate uptake regulator PhoU [Planctomycetota bacterium]
MLKALLAAWRGDNALALMLDQFDQMLAHDQWMFQQAAGAYWRAVVWSDVQGVLYARDKQVNDLERAIRREVVRHLVLHPGSDVPACLIMMSVVKDAERIGDYCKNIFEVGKWFRHEYTSPRYLGPLKEVHETILAMFDKTRKAFRESHVELAVEVIRTFESVKSKCDLIVEQLLRQKDNMPTDEAVSYGMICRHMKRAAAHLANIASSVVTPVENLDFADERIAPTDK